MTKVSWQNHDSEDKGVNEMVTPGGTQKVVFINESGLYATWTLDGLRYLNSKLGYPNF